jgi:hypothetical protein
MLETIREYGLEVLAEQARDLEIRRAHAQLMATIVEENELDLERLDADEDNFRTAIEWAVAANDAELALRLGASLWWMWHVRGRYAEGAARSRRASRCRAAKTSRAREGADRRGRDGVLPVRLRPFDRVAGIFDRARAHPRRSDEPALSLQYRGSIARSAATTSMRSTCTCCRARSGRSSRTGATSGVR